MQDKNLKNNLRPNRINFQIKSRQMRVIDEEGENLGTLTKEQALDLASQKNLDLVEVSGPEGPSVCKVMDYGKYRFQLNKNKTKVKKEQKSREKKEIQVRPCIGDHDLDVKNRRLKEFLEAGMKVQVILKFKGRQLAHPELGLAVLKKMEEFVKDVAKADNVPKVESKRAFLIMVPLKGSWFAN